MLFFCLKGYVRAGCSSKIFDIQEFIFKIISAEWMRGLMISITLMNLRLLFNSHVFFASYQKKRHQFAFTSTSTGDVSIGNLPPGVGGCS